MGTGGVSLTQSCRHAHSYVETHSNFHNMLWEDKIINDCSWGGKYALK